MSNDNVITKLLSPSTIRERARRVLVQAENGATGFSVHREQLPHVAKRVATVTLSNYPDLNIPTHSRWGHFQAGSVNRLAELKSALSKSSLEDRIRAKLDLVVISVLLDAGAGDSWSYHEENSSQNFSRSEGLAIASFRGFLNGSFSHDPNQPYQVTSQGLAKLSLGELEKLFQVNDQNPIPGFEGRHALLLSLAKALGSQPTFFGPTGRPGDLFNWYQSQSINGEIDASKVLEGIQRGLGPIWPGRLDWNGFSLGDVWKYSPLGEEHHNWIPFHKLSQWLTYSILETLEEGGLQVTGREQLTALAEYRNGGLLLDSGLLKLRKPEESEAFHEPGSERIIEWRALTIALIDEVAQQVREILERPGLPLGSILEGGTWAAGRELAAEKREGGGPPLKLKSDGTVF